MLKLRYRRTGAPDRRFTVNGQPARGQYSEGMKLCRLWIPAGQLNGTVEVTVED